MAYGLDGAGNNIIFRNGLTGHEYMEIPEGGVEDALRRAGEGAGETPPIGNSRFG